VSRIWFWAGLALGCLALWQGAYWLGSHNGRKTCNIEWRAEISRLNAETLRRSAAQREQALKIEAEAQAALEKDRAAFEEIAAENAKIQDKMDDVCRFNAERVRLLNRQAAD